VKVRVGARGARIVREGSGPDAALPLGQMELVMCVGTVTGTRACITKPFVDGLSPPGTPTRIRWCDSYARVREHAEERIECALEECTPRGSYAALGREPAMWFILRGVKP